MNTLPAVLRAPRFPDPVTDRISHLLYQAIGSVAVVIVGQIVIAAVAPHLAARQFVAAPVLAAISVITAVLVRAGKVRLAAHLAIILSWTFVSITTWTAGGITSPDAYGFVAVSFFAGLLLGQRAGLVTGTTSILVLLVFAGLDEINLVPPDLVQTPLTEFVEIAIIMVLIVGLQHLAYRDLRSSDARFETIFDAGALGAVLVAPDGQIVRSNEALQHMLGYTDAELAQMRLIEVVHADDAAACRHVFSEISRGARPAYEGQRRYIRKDGSVIQVTVAVSRAPGGYVIGLVHDITAEVAISHERDQLMHGLGERVKELTALHQAARLLDNPGVSVHDVIERVAGLLPPAFEFPDDTVARVSYGVMVCTTPRFRETAWQISTTFRTNDGVTGRIDVDYLRDPRKTGEPFLPEERALLDSLADMLGTSLNQRLAETALRRSQERLTLALSAVEMGTWEWDVVADHMMLSSELTTLCGIGSTELHGRFGDRLGIVHPDDVDGVRRAMREALADPSANRLDHEFRIRRPDGNERWLLAEARVFRDDAGRPARVLGVMIDVTARHLLQQQFMQAQKMEAVGQFAGGIAHDFNNVLMTIMGECDLLLTSELPAGEVRTGLEDIAAAGKRAADLTRRLLTFSRKDKSVPIVLDPNAAIAGMERFIKQLLGVRVALHLSITPDIGTTRVDPGQLEQALMNLVVNARDAMPDGGSVTIATARMPDARIVISVTDTGTGMTDDTKARLFEPFFTTKEAGKGTGLGLAVVFSVMQQAHGEVTVDSVLGRGTTFELRFPLAA